ncbi:leukocyte immunoglobulin-like receptor subfamily A member 6 isoform X3 [Choloepus didactylus]|uniref:leukocyte immunoglobulin-like receptor subfamily A member 6 isoform X3 n=1 Tax=Choloepus didactylus TaxID=27675 RepID=UPI00189F6690|nr:leukocyte immunoglobulin-like receptor subfamily A member 6 isoform X3 [Choloepus didactylus]
MTPTLTALLCLGLSLGQRIRVQAGTLPKPTIWAEPGSVINWGRPVTIWCQGTLEAKEYHLKRAGSPAPWDRKNPQEPRDKAKFSIPHMTENYAGRYHCRYLSSTARSAPSDPLELMVASSERICRGLTSGFTLQKRVCSQGVSPSHSPPWGNEEVRAPFNTALRSFLGSIGKPTLSAWPSPVVTAGRNVTLQCGSLRGFGRFVLSEEGEHEGSWTLDAQRHSNGETQALFPMSSSHRGTFRCYGYSKNRPHVWSEPSDPLELLVPGVSRKPSLLAQLGPIVALGQSLNLQCRSDVSYDRFALSKEGAHDLTQCLGRQPQGGLSQADFPLVRVSSTHGGRYRCYGGHNLSSEWSAPSEPLDVLITGELPSTPSLSAQPGPNMSSGENVTLRCQSRNQMDSFLLSKDGGANPPLRLRSWHRAQMFLANFTVSSVTSAPGDTYRCYGSRSSNPYLLSQPSAPLELMVSAPDTINLPQPQPDSKSGE